MPNEKHKEDEDKTITEIGRELLKYLHRRLEELGTNQASYRQARMELLKQLEENRPRNRFNWGFEAVFTQEIHILEELGLVSVKYGSGAIMAGRTSPNQIYNVSLTGDGKDTARLEEVGKPEELADDEDDDDLEETDRAPEQDESTKVNEKDEDKPAGLPGDAFAKDPDATGTPAEEE